MTIQATIIRMKRGRKKHHCDTPTCPNMASVILNKDMCCWQCYNDGLKRLRRA